MSTGRSPRGGRRSVDCGLGARDINLTMLELRGDTGQTLAKLGVGLGESLQLPFKTALLLLHFGKSLGKTLGGLYLLAGGFAKGGGDSFAQFTQPQDGNHDETRDGNA